MSKKNSIDSLEKEIQSLKDSIAAEQRCVDAANQRVVEKKLRILDIHKQQVSEKSIVAKSRNELDELDRRYVVQQREYNDMKDDLIESQTNLLAKNEKYYSKYMSHLTSASAHALKVFSEDIQKSSFHVATKVINKTQHSFIKIINRMNTCADEYEKVCNFRDQLMQVSHGIGDAIRPKEVKEAVLELKRREQEQGMEVD